MKRPIQIEHQKKKKKQRYPQRERERESRTKSDFIPTNIEIKHQTLYETKEQQWNQERDIHKMKSTHFTFRIAGGKGGLITGFWLQALSSTPFPTVTGSSPAGSMRDILWISTSVYLSQGHNRVWESNNQFQGAGV